MKIEVFVLSLLISISAFSLNSCSKEETLPDDPILGLGGDDWYPTPLDEYLYENFVLPYNIEVKYKWDPYQVNFNRTLVPASEEKVIPVMETVKKVWLDPYEKTGGSGFLKRHQILKYVLVGSPEYQDNGTIVLGTAEGGNKIVLFAVNSYSHQNESEVKTMMHTIHHEYAHILHQSAAIPQSWRGLSDEWYTATWYNTTDEQANSQGLITAYAKASMEEDFVETISFLLVHGQNAYDSIALANPEQYAVFKKKEELIVSYYSDLNINFRDLQNHVQSGIEQLTQ
jgi:substrate import-associated zinc metallohydrolase lipoprotein